MAREISAGLLEATRGFRARAEVALTVRNRRLRWVSRRATEDGQYASDQVADEAPGAPATIHRARVDGAGRLQHAAVTDPANAAQWVAWTTLNQGALPGEDCALARPDPGALRLFYYAVPAAPALRCLETVDGGATWAAPEEVSAIAGTTFYVAAANLRVFVIEQGVVKVWVKARGGGAWSAGPDWAALAPLAAPTGLAATWDSAAASYRVLVAGDGHLWVGSLSVTTGWSEPLQIWPGSDGIAPSDSVPRAPAALSVGGEHWITWVESYRATPAWSQAVVCHSRDWAHFGNEVALRVSTDTPRRVALAYVAATRCLYAANESDVCAAVRWDAADQSQNLAGLTVRAYERHTDERGSRLSVEAIDSARVCGAHLGATLGRAGAPAEPLQALAEVCLERGYLVDGAPEREALDPHYLVSMTYSAGRKRGRLMLQAVDGWGLLDLWRPAMPLTWRQRPVRWLLAELAARVGLAYEDDGTSAFDYRVPDFTALPSQSGAEAARALLGLAGAVARFTADGTLYALNLYANAPMGCIDLGGKREIIEGDFGPAARYGTAFRVYGDGVGYAAENVTAAMALGLRLHRQKTDYRLDTAEQAARVGAYGWTRARMAARREGVTVPLRPDPELWDRARLLVGPEVVSPAEALRRVVGIDEEYLPWRGRCLTHLALEQE